MRDVLHQLVEWRRLALEIRKDERAPLRHAHRHAHALDERIVIVDLGAPLFEQPDDVERRALAHVVDVALVRDAEDENPAAVDRLPIVVERGDTFSTTNSGICAVDLARQIDEARLVVQRPHLPREVVRVERNAVSADARARRELHEAERLRRGRVDDLPHVDAELVADDRHLVDEPDVDRAERVLEQLHQLGRFGRRHRDDRVDARSRRAPSRLRCRRRDAADDLRRVLRVVHFGLPGSTRSGLKARKTSLPTVRPRSSSVGSITSRVVPG